jgi:hypothetical protein
MELDHDTYSGSTYYRKRNITLLRENNLPDKVNVIFFGVSQTVKKGKAIPLQAWTGPEGSRRLRFPDFKTIGT